DMAFADPVVPGPVRQMYQGLLGWEFPVWTVVPEQALAWKVHGLFEFWDTQKGRWRMKDLYDICLLMRACEMDSVVFRAALKVAFEDRVTPFRVYQKVLDGNFGQSRGSRQNWARFVADYPANVEAESHLDLLAEARKLLDPVFRELMDGET
ncbi:MAG: nucleotidyl transferase AbiEii/AbiGii toxin family protein, partial [Bacteroidota bacterium]